MNWISKALFTNGCELLAGLSVDVIDQVYAERVRPMAGARILVQTMRRWGAEHSPGFRRFHSLCRTGRRCSRLRRVRRQSTGAVRDGRLTGRVLEPITGPEVKLATLQRLMRQHDLSPSETLAVGDGANDLPMIRAAGLGVAYRAHAPVAEVSAAAIQVGDLTALLYLQGVPKSEFFTE